MRITLKSITSLFIALLFLLSSVPAMALGPEGEEDMPSPENPDFTQDWIEYTSYGNEAALTYLYIYNEWAGFVPTEYQISGTYDGVPVTTIATKSVATGSSSIVVFVPPSVTKLESQIMTGKIELRLVFLGHAPQFASDALKGGYVTIEYPASDPTWDSVVGQQFGGTVTWKTACNHTFSTTDSGVSRCSVCSVYCYHGYDSNNDSASIVTPPTCTEDGSANLACIGCGYLKQITVPATGHRYENNMCLDCGDMIWEPNGPEVDYTYIGNAYAVTYFHPHSKSVCSLPEKYDGFPVTTLGDGCLHAESYMTDFENFTGVHVPYTLILPASITTVQSRITNTDGTITLYFRGNAPSFAEDAFLPGATVIVEYPYGASGWEQVAGQYFGGTDVTWCPYCPEHSYADGKCIYCGEEDPDYGEHSFNEGVLYAPTCTEDGHRDYTCTDCGYVKQVTVPATGHDLENGNCKNCDYVCEHQYKYLEGIGYCTMCDVVCEHHRYNPGSDIPISLYRLSLPSNTECGKAGYVIRTCSACDHSYVEGFTVIPHFFENAVCIFCGITENKDYSYTILEDGTCLITKSHRGDLTLVVPETINGYTVSEIGNNAFFWGTNKTVTLPSTVRKIHYYAFEDSDLKELFLTGDAPQIDDSAFTGTVVTIYYPAGNETYTGELMSNLPVNVTWKSYCPEHSFVVGKCEYCGETDPDWTEPSGSSLSGEMQLPCENVRVQLYLGEELIGTATIESSRYRFDGLGTGEFTLKVSCEGGVPREYAVTVNEGDNTLDVVLSRPGDVNGDRAVNVGDVAMIYAHSRGITLLDGYGLQCADLNGDGQVNIGDVAMAYCLSKL